MAASASSPSDAARTVQDRLQAQEATIGVVGLGYVGLPLAVQYARRGFETLGIDLDARRVQCLRAGDNYIDDVDDEDIQTFVADGRLQVESSFERAAEVDVFFVCVPTPMTDAKNPDLTYVESAVDSVAQHLRPGQLIVLKSTTYPGTTDEVVRPLLEAGAADTHLEIGRDYFLAFSPERIDPGNETYQAGTIPVVAGAMTDAGASVTEAALHAAGTEVHLVPNPKVAEMEKLLENIFRSVNIALVNELAQLCDRMGGMSMWEVIDAAATKPFGFMPFYPGPGLGGHCIPIDPHFLSWTARRHDFETSFITLSAQVNEQMPFYVTTAVVEAIANRPVRLQDASVLVLGVAYKGNVSDTRHSPAARIIQQLWDKDIEHVCYHDPHVPTYSIDNRNGVSTHVPAVDSLTPQALQACDVAVLVTDHDAYDGEKIVRHAPHVIDTRNALAGVTAPHLRQKITLLGEGAVQS